MCKSTKESYLKEIYFTQYLFPSGETQQISILRPEDVFIKAEALKTLGFKFEIENKNGKIWGTIINVDTEEYCDFFCQNGPEIHDAVDETVARAYKKFAESQPKNEEVL